MRAIRGPTERELASFLGTSTNVASMASFSGLSAFTLIASPPTCGRVNVVEMTGSTEREISASFLGTSVSVVVGLSAFTIDFALALLALLGLLALSQFPRTRLLLTGLAWFFDLLVALAPRVGAFRLVQNAVVVALGA